MATNLSTRKALPKRAQKTGSVPVAATVDLVAWNKFVAQAQNLEPTLLQLIDEATRLQASAAQLLADLEAFRPFIPKLRYGISSVSLPP